MKLALKPAMGTLLPVAFAAVLLQRVPLVVAQLLRSAAGGQPCA